MFLVFGKLLSGQPKSTSATTPPLPLRARGRRGHTAMEYLAVISLIFIVVMSAVNYFAQTTKTSLQDSGSAIEKATSGTGKP